MTGEGALLRMTRGKGARLRMTGEGGERPDVLSLLTPNVTPASNVTPTPNAIPAPQCHSDPPMSFRTE